VTQGVTAYWEGDVIEDQIWLDYLWDFETKGINLDFSSMLLSPGLDID